MSARTWQIFGEKELGVPLEFRFVPGAGGLIATNTLLSSPADGYTIMIHNFANFHIMNLLYDGDVGVDDIAPLGAYYTDPGVFFVHKDSPYQTFEDVMAFAKANPGQFRISFASFTDMSYLLVRQIETLYDVEFNLVNYEGGNAARLAVVNREVDACSTTWFAASPVWDDIRVLAQLMDTVPLAGLEGVRTISNILDHDFPDIHNSYFIFAPPTFERDHPERFKTLASRLAAAWNGSEYYESMKERGEESAINVMTPEETLKTLVEMGEFIHENAHLFE